MHHDYKRRSVLAGSGVMALSGVGLAGGALRGGVTKSRASSGAAYRIAAVSAVHGRHVTVEGDTGLLLLESAPAGCRAAVGDQVVVGPSPVLDGVTAELLVHWVNYTASLAEVVPGRRLGGSAGPLVITSISLAPSLVAHRGTSAWTATRHLSVMLTDHVSGSARNVRVLSVREA